MNDSSKIGLLKQDRSNDNNNIQGNVEGGNLIGTNISSQQNTEKSNDCRKRLLGFLGMGSFISFPIANGPARNHLQTSKINVLSRLHLHMYS